MVTEEEGCIYRINYTDKYEDRNWEKFTPDAEKIMTNTTTQERYRIHDH